MDPASIAAITEGLSTVLPLVVGPFGAIIICFLGLVFCGYIVVKHLLPSVEKRFEDSQTNIDKLMIEHKEDREVFKDAINTLNQGQTAITNKLDILKDEVKDLTHEVDNLKDSRTV